MTMRPALIPLLLLVACGAPVEAPPPPEPVRFVALGDTGEGNPDQYAVAAAMKTVCAADGCDFALLLGDNFYDVGVDSIDDPQWQEKFELPYAEVDLPFFAVLGNHDLGGAGVDWWRGPVEVEYDAVSDKWHLPAPFYEVAFENVGFLMLETNSIFWDEIEYGDQADWIPGALTRLSAIDWVIGAGHHPYRSNGPHGNAGDYEQMGVDVPYVDGKVLKAFFDENLCGVLDVYLCGHDHSRQWLVDDFCGAELIVSGAGAKTTAVVEDRNAYHFQAATEGFLWVEIEGDRFTGRFYDAAGTLEFERTFTREAKP